MTSNKELSDKADEIQAALDAEQVEIALAIASLQVSVDALTAQLADGGTPEERQAVLDKLSATLADLKATVA